MPEPQAWVIETTPETVERFLTAEYDRISTERRHGVDLDIPELSITVNGHLVKTRYAHPLDDCVILVCIRPGEGEDVNDQFACFTLIRDHDGTWPLASKISFVPAAEVVKMTTSSQMIDLFLKVAGNR